MSSRRRHTRLQGDWRSDVCSSDLEYVINRRDSMGMGAYIQLIPYAMGFELTDRLRAHPLTNALELCCSDYANILNDVISFPAEYRSEERRVGTESQSKRGRWHVKQKTAYEITR